MLLSIIIVNYNVKYFLEQCLSSVIAAIKTIDAEVWVVDNASTDGGVDHLRHKFPSAKLKLNASNVGFGKANNQALKECSGKYVLFLNPDTLIAEDCLEKCLAFMEDDKQVGALGVRMIDGSGDFLPESKRSLPSAMSSFYKLTGLSKLFPSSRTFSRYALSYLNEYENHEVDVLAGAFLMARREVLTKLKGFDEAFFMYGEDIDLSYRIQKSGYKNIYFSKSTIIHFKGESAKKGSLNYVKIFYEAMSIFVKKHYTGAFARSYILFIQVAIWLRAGVSAAAGFVSTKQKSLLKASNQIVKRQKSIVVGTEDEYNEVKDILVKAEVESIILGRVTVDEKTEDALGPITDLPALIQKMDATAIIFCSGNLGYRIIIDIIQKLPKEVSFRFHGKGTGSIVGSDSKNTQGEFIAAPINI